MALESLSSFSSTGTVSGTNTVNNTQKINTVAIGTGDITIDATKIPFSASDSTNVNAKITSVNNNLSANITSVDESAVHIDGVETITGTKTFTPLTKFSEGINIVCNDGSSYQIRNGGNAGNELIIIMNGDESNGNNSILSVNANSIKIGSTTHSSVKLGYDVEDTSNSNEVATTKWVNTHSANAAASAAAAVAVPAGTVIAYAGTSTPAGYLFCDGSPVSRTTYSKLFAAIGTIYGKGDNSTTFNLPNFNGKFAQGSATPGTEKDPSIQYTHYHGFGDHTGNNNGWFISLQNKENFDLVSDPENPDNSGIRWWNGNDGGGENIVPVPGKKYDCNLITTLPKSTTDETVVQPPALTMRYCIKY